jgi:hypothetical protein
MKTVCIGIATGAIDRHSSRVLDDRFLSLRNMLRLPAEQTRQSAPWVFSGSPYSSSDASFEWETTIPNTRYWRTGKR